MSLKEKFVQLKNDKQRRIKLFTLLGLLYNIVWSVGKVLFGIFTRAFFFSISGIYTLFIGIIKSLFYRHYKKTDIKKEFKVSIAMGVLIIISALAFVLYMARLFFIDDDMTYGQITSIAIAAFSFSELGISIGNFVRSVKAEDMMLTGLRSCNVASGFYAIVLTQVAITSACGTPNSKGNALGGTVFGLCALAMGVALLVQIWKKYNKIVGDVGIDKSDETGMTE